MRVVVTACETCRRGVERASASNNTFSTRSLSASALLRDAPGCSRSRHSVTASRVDFEMVLDHSAQSKELC